MLHIVLCLPVFHYPSLPSSLYPSARAARMDAIIVIKPVCNGLCWPGFCYANAERLEACCRAARSNLFCVSWGEHTLGILHPSHEVRSAPTLLYSTHAPVLCVCQGSLPCVKIRSQNVFLMHFSSGTNFYFNPSALAFYSETLEGTC